MSTEISQQPPLHEDLTEVCPQLYVGSLEATRHEVVPKSSRFTHVLSCLASSLQDSPGAFHKCIPIEPDPFGGEQINIQAAVEFLHEVIENGGVAVVHCELGKNRSPAVAAAYLCYTQGIELKKAIEFIREKRPEVKFSPAVIGALKNWASKHAWVLPSSKPSPTPPKEDPTKP